MEYVTQEQWKEAVRKDRERWNSLTPEQKKEEALQRLIKLGFVNPDGTPKENIVTGGYLCS